MRSLTLFFSLALLVLLGTAVSENTSPVLEEGDYYVYVHVSHPDGGDYSGAKIVGSVCWGGMTETVYTDRNGNAKLVYYSNEDLCKIFVNGKTREGRWESGSTARFTAR